MSIQFANPKQSPAKSKKRRLELALKFAAMGVPVFPCGANLKTPLIKDFPNNATTDAALIRHWFTKYADCNYGLAMGREFTPPDGGEVFKLAAIDLDKKNGNDGDASLEGACAAAGVDLPILVQSLIIQKTPSGGVHLIGLARQSLKTCAAAMPGVDIRGQGGYIVGAGSIADGAEYELINDAPLSPLGPLEDLFEKAGERAPAKETTQKIIEGVDKKRAMRRAFEYLAMAPVGQAGQRNDTAYKIAARFKEIGLSEHETLGYMAQWNDAKCEPPLDGDELQDAINHAYKYSQNPQGDAAPEAKFEIFT